MGAPIAMQTGAHCGFRRYIHFRRGLTLQIKFVYSLNSLKYQLSQSKPFGQALRTIAAGACSDSEFIDYKQSWGCIDKQSTHMIQAQLRGKEVLRQPNLSQC